MPGHNSTIEMKQAMVVRLFVLASPAHGIPCSPLADQTAYAQNDRAMLSNHFPERWAEPIMLSRVLVAIAIAAGGMALAFYGFKTELHSDFGASWFGARAMLEHRDPYLLIGRGKEFDHWPLLYPAPALVFAIPFAALTERAATVLFVGVSTFLLAFGVTRRSWHLLPLFITEPYTSSARLGQWSILFAAGLFFSSLTLISICKPQAALPVLVALRKKKSLVAAMAGGAVLMVVSLVLLPHWPVSFYENVRAAPGMEPPIVRLGGFMVLLALMRWRRPETWLLIATACMPQAWGWYGTLALFTVPRSFAESVALAGAVAIGGWVGVLTMPAAMSLDSFFAWSGALIVFSVYLPVTALILLRPNAGGLAQWAVSCEFLSAGIATEQA